jgi:two-component system OmpR family response regulator
MKLLVVDDDADLAHAIATFLRSWCFAVDVALTAARARDLIREFDYTLVLLDLAWPACDGLYLLSEIRSAKRREFAFIMSACTDLALKIESLESGADDYLIKPFDFNEMLARIRAVTRRRSDADPWIPVRYLNGVAIDLEGKTVMRGDQKIALTAKEWFVIERLVTTPHAIVGKTQLQDALYASGREADSNTIEVYVSQIRRKLGTNFVETVRGLGYRIGGTN